MIGSSGAIPATNQSRRTQMKQITRRTFWSVSALSILLLAPAQGQAPSNPFKTLVGTWKVTVSPDAIPPFTAFNQFNADGSSVEFDNSNPPSQQTVAVGPWERNGDRDYTMLEVNQLFDDHGYAGEFRVQAKITLDASGDTFTSTFTFQVLDISDNVVFQGGGTAKGRRITIDSLARLIP
jgi:hypothetical protein